ncbi:hypothetical protein D3C76_1717700 [compost metagenome]
MRKQGVALKDGINVTMFGGNIGDVLIFKMNLAVVDVFQSGNQAQNGCLAAARRAKQREKLTVIDSQVKIVNDGFTIETFADPRQKNQR